jgi:hypothetical protein
MKNLTIKMIAALILSFFAITTQAQQTLQSIAVLNIDSKDAALSPEKLSSLARIEVTKTGMFEVMDAYDISYLFEKNNFNPANCYGKICLVEAGNILKVDKVFSGFVEAYQDRIVITFRLLDVQKGKIEKAEVMEFINLQNQLHLMISVTIKKMFDLEVDKDLINKLTKKNDFESTVNIPDEDALNLSGPRMGVTFFTGEVAKIYQRPKSEGGFDALPIMSQFGYQFEVKYLNEGSVQALFEFIPVITGLDQGRIIPSITALSGIRSNKNGFEFAFGPNIFISQMAKGYVNAEGDFILGDSPEGVDQIKRLDSRGDYTLGTGLVLAAGKTFRSGKLNIPVNAFFIPGKNGHRIGLSFGFNINRT